MATRLQRVEALLCREIADVVLFGNLRDPRLQPTSAISITGVRVSPDLSTARVFVDVMSAAGRVADIIAGLNAGASAVRREVAARVRLRRMPALRFVQDESITRGASIERIIVELHEQAPAPAPDPDDERDD
jgi:ribosome-binding factor A